MNSDVRDLSNAVTTQKIQLGAEVTRGMGAGGDPELGERAAIAEEAAIREAVNGRDMVFVCAGLGGGTGSGAAPYIAKLARETGAFVVSFVTMPFTFEGRRRIEQAEDALTRLQNHCNALIAFDNDRMGQIALDKDGIGEAFAAADQVISQSIRAVTSLVTQPGLIRIGMDDIMTALRNNDSRCLFGFGQSKGKTRAQDALKAALRSPLLDRGALLERAANVLVHIAGGDSMTLYEIEGTMKELNRHVPDSAQILFGVATDPKLEESLSVTIITSMQGEGGDPGGSRVEATTAGVYEDRGNDSPPEAPAEDPPEDPPADTDSQDSQDQAPQDSAETEAPPAGDPKPAGAKEKPGSATAAIAASIRSAFSVGDDKDGGKDADALEEAAANLESAEADPEAANLESVETISEPEGGYLDDGEEEGSEGDTPLAAIVSGGREASSDEQGNSRRNSTPSSAPSGESESEDQATLELEKSRAGRFEKSDPTIVDGDDLDVPTFLRKKR